MSPELLELLGVLQEKAEAALGAFTPAQRDLLKAAGRIGAEQALKYVQERAKKASEIPPPPPAPPNAEAQRARDLAILGLAEGASEKELKRAYRKQARAHHPDRGGSASKMQQINAAYERLTAK